MQRLMKEKTRLCSFELYQNQVDYLKLKACLSRSTMVNILRDLIDAAIKKDDTINLKIK